MDFFEHEEILRHCGNKEFTPQCNAFCVLKAVEMAILVSSKNDDFITRLERSMSFLPSSLRFPCPVYREHILNIDKLTHDDLLKKICHFLHRVKNYVETGDIRYSCLAQEYLDLIGKSPNNATKLEAFEIWTSILSGLGKVTLEKIYYEIVEQYSNTVRMILSSNGMVSLNYDKISLRICIQQLRKKVHTIQCSEFNRVFLHKLLDIAQNASELETLPPSYKLLSLFTETDTSQT